MTSRSQHVVDVINHCATWLLPFSCATCKNDNTNDKLSSNVLVSLSALVEDITGGAVLT